MLCGSAEQIAKAAHEAQVDKAGVPYVEHPRRVTEWVQHLYADVHQDVIDAAWLHDVLEDTAVTVEYLREAGITERTISCVAAVTKRPGESIEDYFGRVVANPDAVMVKHADLADNTDPARLAKLPVTMRDRLQRKYTRAFELLGVEAVHVSVD